ncbi:putative DBH-like monooxygenase protein 2 [Dysidea avara]|uniref:putative DBH-like monooxygenase protein 2 n=1 Tax=Dysidea avara TaxID=196820 RepID=UPI00332EC545
MNLSRTLLVALFIIGVSGFSYDELSRQYDCKLQLDSAGNYTMFYTIDEDDKLLSIAIHVQTTGWVGLGLSPTGQMPGSDVVIGWVDNSGASFFQDRYAFDRTIPRYDGSQDWKFIGSSEDNGITTFLFERLFETCDEGDIAISAGDTTHLIYSYHSEDPIDNQHISQHEFQGVKTVNLFGQLQNTADPPANLQYVDVVNANVTVPSKDTTYLCTLIELPSQFKNKTHYLVKTAAQITPDSARHVHHMLLYLCDGFNLTGDPAVGVSQECNGISQKILPCRSSIVIASWAVSGNDFTYPADIALPIGGADKIHTHYLLEMHYDNPDKISGIVDSSGMRLYFSDKPRQEVAGIVTLGKLATGHMIIPPGVQRYTVRGFCANQCTNANFPEEGITVFANLLHTHTAGAELILRHIRNGTELKPIDVNRNYDFNYQQINIIPSAKILKGDEMILECVYNTGHRNTTTFGGESTSDEMCISVLYYYPATNLSNCLSYTIPSAYAEWMSTYLLPEQYYAIAAAAVNNISSARPVFDSLDWSEENYRMLERIGQTSEQVNVCVSGKGKNYGSTFASSKPPLIEVPFEGEGQCVKGSNGSPSVVLVIHSSNLVMIIVMCLLTIYSFP